MNPSDPLITPQPRDLHTFFTRITEWDYPDQPRTGLVFREDRPRLDRPLPKFLDDAAAAAFMTAAARLPDELDRLMVQILARTGMRRGELLGLRIDAVVQIGTGYWLRTPVGKLHTDRYIPLDPALKTLIDGWIAKRPSWQASDLLLLERGRPIPPTRVDKAVQKAATTAGIGHVHPHQLRHTLATQAINRGMSLEAIAALLGHTDLSMTMVYARIGDRTVADQYFQVTSKIEALYRQAQPTPATPVLPADAAGPAMTALHAEVAKRLLGNGYCRRPVELDCRYETICETCPMFFTTHEHRPLLQAQRDDACARPNPTRRGLHRPTRTPGSSHRLTPITHISRGRPQDRVRAAQFPVLPLQLHEPLMRVGRRRRRPGHGTRGTQPVPQGRSWDAQLLADLVAGPLDWDPRVLLDRLVHSADRTLTQLVVVLPWCRHDSTLL